MEPASPTPSLVSLPSLSSRSSSPSLFSASDSEPDSPKPPPISKREYLLAQIKQKDAIIESLLKQLHNPYIATPLSIASYRMATSPSDTTNSNVLAWLDRLQASVSTAGGKVGPNAFKLDTRGIQDIAEEEESEDEDPATVGVISPSEDEDADDEEEIDPMRSALPDSHVPLGLIANLSLSNKKSKGKGKKDPKGDALDDNLDDDDVVCLGVANETYFMPGPATDLGIRATLIEQHSPPEILVHGLVTPEDVDKLFEIFYTRVNPFISLLDPVLHTPANTFARCPFLFTVVCAISSRYYPQKSEIYPIAMHFAKHSAANALIDGWKSVELCQAYILMSVYAVPARRWEEDRSWLYTGLAIRIATDLNLHQASPLSKATSEKQEREILNRTRVWMICYNLDRSTATQFGKPSTIKDDYIVRNAKDWYKKSSYAHTFDIHLCGYSALLRIVAKFHDEIFSDPSTPSGLNRRLDFRAVTMAHDAHLNAYNEEWSRRFAQDSDPNDRAAVFRCNLLPFLVEYSRLVMFSFGFQQAFQRGLQPGDHVFFNKCLDAAKAVIRQMIEVLAPSGYMRYAPDGHFIFASFASAFLLKLLRPEFSNLLSKEHENEIFDLIGRLIQTLSSSEIAIDDRHTPKLYARFLAGLLSKHRRDGATAGRLHPHPPPSRQAPQTVSSTPQGGQSSSALGRDNAPMTTTFSINPPRNSGSGGQRRDANTAGGSAYTNSNAMTGVQFDSPASSATFVASPGQDTTPVYTSEVTFAAGVGPIHLGSDFDFGVITDEEMLATMQIIKNPAFWDTMMMPGFSMDPQSPMSNGNTPSPYNPSAPPFASGFGPMHSVQAHLH
ncbi:hypothetical protein BDN72DRAFT_493272 [Pluteus cervinus]|uniref:Uncharacterized protein n=1 Tax=Pluteus cervinus TaxID=181527 RepID=A0ACD3AZ06_9AGAR|nr:hypothetical protein BDN72DRAFT_493272 [Pluteus cervinus]